MSLNTRSKITTRLIRLHRVLSTFALLVAAVACAGPQAAAPGPALVTVSGAIAERNRPRFEPFGDAFFNYHDATFETAYAFDRASLADLGMHELTVKYDTWPRAVTARGPRIADLLAHVGATADTVAIEALDGYTVEFARDELIASPAILAIEADGKPLGIGGRGPAWLVFAPGDLPSRAADDDAGLVWAAYHIAVH